MLRSIALLLGLLGLVFPGRAPALPETAEEIRACVRGNLPALSMRQEVRFKTVDRVGGERVTEAEIFWRRFESGGRSLLRFSSPSDIRGSALLLIQQPSHNDMFMYLPELKRVRRVTGRNASGSMFGTDFSYEDFERLQGLAEDTDARRLPDETLKGSPVFVLETRPARREASQYERIVSRIDRESCVAIDTELYEPGGRLRKHMESPRERVVQRGTGWAPTRVLMKDRVDKTRTELIVEELVIDEDLPRKLFTERELLRSGR